MSDIHFQTKQVTFNTKQLRDALPDYLKSNIKEPIKGMFLTGDYRFAPEKELNATKVVEYILECAKTLGVPQNGSVKKFVSMEKSTSFLARISI